MIFRVLTALLLFLGAPASAQMNSFFPGPGTAHSAAAGPSLAVVGVQPDTGSGNATVTLNGDIGTATATRVILIATNRQNTGGFSGVTVNGVSASVIQNSADQTSTFWALVGSAAGSGPQNIVATGGVFELRNVRAWVMDGLSSTTMVQGSTAAAANSISGVSLNAGDYWFANAFTLSGSRNWNTSSPAATVQYDTPDNTGAGVNAQWTIGSNTTGTATVSGGTTTITQVSFR